MTTYKLFYIHISCENLPHYFSYGHISPAIFYENRNQDFQTNNPKAILISDKLWNPNCDCSIECLISDNEQLNKINEDYFVFSSFLAISRITKIFYKNKKLAENVIWSTNETTAFIPSRLLEYKEYSNTDAINDEVKNINYEVLSEQLNKLKKEINAYEIILGAFALSKILRFNYIDNRLSYSELFLKLLVAIKENIKKEAKIKKLDISNLLGLFGEVQTPAWNQLKKLINTNIDNNYILEYAKNKNINIKEKFNIILLNEVEDDALIYYMTILATYGEGKPKSIDDFVTDLESDKIKSIYKEIATILIGLNHGYRNLRHTYFLQNINVPIKFKLENKLDFYTLETIYNYCKKINNFSYETLTKCFILPESEIKKIDKNKCLGHYIFDSNLITTCKLDFMSPEYILNILQSYLSSNDNDILTKYINKNKILLNIADTKFLSFKTLSASLINEIAKDILLKVSADYKTINKKRN
jgi:hypothetical protein